MEQRVVTEFLTTEEVSATQVHRRLNSVYGEHTVGVSAVRRRVRHFKSGETEIGDKPLSDRPPAAVTADNHGHIDALPLGHSTWNCAIQLESEHLQL
jgi:hypothetical protein